jgi:hypothetical protein
MKSSTILLLICLSTMAFAVEVEEMTTMTSKAADAVDAALQVLYDLRQANYDAQDAADERNKTNQANGEAEIADLWSIAEANKATGDLATSTRKFYEAEIVATEAGLAWIYERRNDIRARQAEFQDQRCFANQIFVQGLADFTGSLQAIDLLRNDLFPAAGRTEEASLAEIQEKASAKLTQYKHLFNEQAMAAFEQLASAEQSTLSNANEGDLEDQISGLLDTLETHLESALASSESNEVQAAWQLANWLTDSDDEVENLNYQEDRLNVYLDKINIAVASARAHENKAWEIYFQSSSNYHNAVTTLIWKGEAYLEDKHVRADETALIDELIKLFKEQVSRL